MKTCVIIGAGGRGKDAYAPYIKQSGLMKIVGVVEPDDKKRMDFQRDYDISDEMCFVDYQDFFAKGRLADAVLICTQDRMHFEPAKLAIENEYHILLEKPISPVREEIDKLAELVNGYQKVFITGYVLRYTPFIKKIEEIINSGVIGRVVTMQLNENESFWHHSHSYVRGPWNNTKNSAPLIVAKSCHDMDLIHYLVKSKCTSVSSYGDNSFFTKANAPKDAPDRCTDGCKYADSCKYNAVTLYTKGKGSYFVHKFECENDEASIIQALKTNEYGRCVFKCENDVCDHQIVGLAFENGVTATFTVSAFSLENTRTLKIMGTEGEIGGCIEKGEIVVKTFLDMKEKSIKIVDDGTKHSGGDSGLIQRFAELMERESDVCDMSVFESHKMAFAAEESRLKHCFIQL